MTQTRLSDNQRLADSTDWPDIEKFAVNTAKTLPELYEHTAGWGGQHYSEKFGARVVKPRDIRVTEPIHPLPANFVALRGDPVDFLQVNGVREINIPTTYKALENWESIVSTVTATSPQYGYGLSRHDLRGLLRLTNGSGRIDEETRVFQCQNDWFLGAGPRGCFIIEESVVDPYGFGKSRDGNYEDHIDLDEVLHVNGDAVPEENKSHQQALQKFITVFERYTSTDIVGYRSYGGSHTFIDSNGDSVHATGLRLLKEMETEQDAIIGEHSHEVGYHRHYSEHKGKEFTHHVSPADIKHDIGETTHDALGNDRYVIGYIIRWDEVEYIYSRELNKVELELNYVYFEEPNKYDYHDIDIRTTTEVLATFEIEPEEDQA